ncbi:Tetratricopeptide repeat protein [compost metagenome]
MCRAITYYKDLKDYKSAILDLNKAIELSPKNDEHLAKRALVFTICGEKQSALNDIKKSLEINPNNTIAQNLLKQVKD